MAAQLYKTSTGRMFHAGSIALVTCGLPARGKTYLAHKLDRYLRWLGVAASIFSVSDYRRKHIGSQVQSDFFTSPDTEQLRLDIANRALDDLIEWLTSGCGQVGIYDASNTEKARRDYILDKLTKNNIQVLFIEAICDKNDVIDANVRQVKLTSPDYTGMNPDDAVKDFLKRIDGYRKTYTTIDDTNLSFIKDINVGETIIVNRVKGYLPTRIVYYLMNLHIVPRRIYLARNGQSLNDSVSRLDPPLSPVGEKYAENLPIALQRIRESQNLSGLLKVWTSPRQRSLGSAYHFSHAYTIAPCHIFQKASLVPINMGVFNGLSVEAIQESQPEEFERHLKDPYNHRFPRAESYHDLALRLEPCLLELEREREDLLIIAHESVLQCLYAYLMDRCEQDIPKIVIPEDTIIELRPIAYGCEEKHYFLDV